MILRTVLLVRMCVSMFTCLTELAYDLQVLC